MRYEVTLVRYVPDYVYCEVEAKDKATAAKKAKRAAKLLNPSLMVESFGSEMLTTGDIRIDAKSIDVRELSPDVSR